MTGRRRALTLLVIAPLACGLALAGVVTAAWLALGSPRPADASVWLQVTDLTGVDFTNAPEQPFFVLVVGTGARSDDPAESADDPGLADALHVIGVNPALRSATILDIPRDTEGPTGAKMNSYIVNSDENFGLRAQADAVSAVTGLPISYVIRANFPNFVQMVDEIGGIDVDLPYDLVDEFSGADFVAGPNHLNGDQALALSRARYALPRGDIDRTLNQGLVLLAGLETIQTQLPSAGATVRLVAIAGRHVKLDGIGVRDLFALGQLSLAIDPANVKNVVLPVGSGSGGNLVKTADAEPLLADMADDGVLQNH